MKPDPNANQKQQLEEKLSETGWKIVSRQMGDFAWWADEQWIIESQWSPQGFRLFLTFLVDPQHDGNRPKGVGVWAIVASPETPTDRSAEGPSVRLRTAWGKELPAFLASLSVLRDQL